MGWLFVFGYLLYLIGILKASYVTYYFQQANDIKCCKPNEILSTVKQDEKFVHKCQEDESKTLTIRTTFGYQQKFPQAPCIDVMEKSNGTRSVIRIDNINSWATSPLSNTNFLPKCCPINYTYHHLEHRCIESKSQKFSTEFLDLYLQNNTCVVIKPGLGNCESVIVDQEFQSLQDIMLKLNEDMSILIGNNSVAYGKYCFDEAYTSDKYVLRICYPNFDVCRSRKHDNSKIKCIRKCCPDGQMYRDRTCEDNLYQGFNFINDSRFTNSTEQFAIIAHDCNKFLSDDEDVYSVDEKGHVRFRLQENPPVFYSPFKDSYCYENVKMDNSDQAEIKLFICYKKNLPSSSLNDDDNDDN